jgi:DNA topoisomerase-3
LFKRKYVVRERKNLIPTSTGIDLIDTISNDLLKSVELTGIWERKLRLIEKGEYEATSFMDEMKTMVRQLVHEVKHEHKSSIAIYEEKKKESARTKKKADKSDFTELVGPKCKKHKLLKGKSAYGCAGYKEGCDFKVDFINYGKKITDKQLITLIEIGKTSLLKGFTMNGSKLQGKLFLNNQFLVELETRVESKAKDDFMCPVCGKGKILKGKAAYGCSRYREGCKTIVSFKALQEKYGSTDLTEEKIKEVLERS